MASELKTRDQVPVELTWDLTAIYKTDEEMFEALSKAESIASHMVTNYKGKMTSPETILACMKEYEQVMEIIAVVSNYVELAVSVDYTNAKVQEVCAKASARYSKILSNLSFIDSEIVAQDAQVIEKAIELASGCKNLLQDILRSKAHQLHPEAERVLAAISHTVGAPYELYEMSKLADMQFEDFEVNGEKYPLGYSLFEDDYEYDKRTDVRRAAFAAFSKKLAQYQNVTATAYNAHVQHEKIMSDLRGFDNVFDSLLFDQKVTMEMYNRQIDLIMDKLAPHMRKYAKQIQKIYKLDHMTFADLKLPIDPEYDPKVSIEESKDYIKKGLSILGEDYVAMIEDAYKERWIDFAQNVGKSTGGFCASPYGAHSYILLSWNERMSDVFTLAHELGHAGHFKSCNSTQSVFDTEVSTYMVESPSTMNELLLAHYLLKTNSDKRFQRWVLANMIGNTYYHNFVTHLLEAAYQREVYRIVDAGGSVSADSLNEIMHDTLTKFWGDAVELPEGAKLTWMRQPHYYMGLYSYTYSAGLTVATQVCKRIEKEGQPAVDDWKKVWAAGSTLDPIGLAALAKVDITNDKALLDTIETIGGYIDQICKLSDELGF